MTLANFRNLAKFDPGSGGRSELSLNRVLEVNSSVVLTNLLAENPMAMRLNGEVTVDWDGTIYQILEETAIGRHVIGMNHLSIGIENVGDRNTYPLTQAQVEANAALIRHLSDRHEITHVIGHYEYREMEGHPYFKEQRDHFRTVRGDPGEDFMRELRMEIRDLGLQGPPPFPQD